MSIKRTKSRPFLLQSILLILFIFICIGVGWAGSQVSPGGSVSSTEWFNQLNKPEWNPPSWLFGPVWTILYIFMGIAAWRIWKVLGFKEGSIELSAFAIQLVLNGVWSFIFFGLQNPGFAFVEIIILLGAIIATTYLFFQHDKLAGWLMVPYILWVSFATVLNGSIWLMN